MIDYADYEYYSNTYKGSLSSDLFTSIIGKACREIDKVTNRDILEADLTTYPKIKWICCEMIDLINDENKSLVNISIDGVSKTNLKTIADYKNDKNNILNSLPLELISYL